MGSGGVSPSAHTVTVGKSSSATGLDMTSVSVATGLASQSATAESKMTTPRAIPETRTRHCCAQALVGALIFFVCHLLSPKKITQKDLVMKCSLLDR